MFENYFCAYCTLVIANPPSQADFSLLQKEKRQTFRFDVLIPMQLHGGRASSFFFFFFFFQKTAGTIVCCSTSTPGAVPGWLWNGTIFSLVSSSWGVRQMTRSHSPVVCSFRSSGVIFSLVNPFLLSCFSLAFPLLFRYNCAILSATPCSSYAASGIFSIGGIL